MKEVAGKLLVVATLVAGLGGCRSGPTVEDAESLLAKGNPDAALEAARLAEQAEAEPAAQARARRVAFEASLDLGRSDLAARTLGRIQTTTGERDRLLERLAGTTLLAALQSPDAGRRAVAASDLVLVAPHAKLSVLVDRALADPEAGVRESAVAAVARLESGAAVARLTRLVSDDASPDVRDAAGLALAARVPGQTRPDEDPELVRARALLASRTARRSPAPGTFALASAADLETALASSDYELRLAGVRAVGERLRGGDTTRWAGKLTQFLDDPAEPVRTAVVEALAATRDGTLLETIAATHADAPTRRRAFLARDRVAPLSTADLVAALERHDPSVSPEAARLLGERGGTAAVAPLVRALAQGRAERPAAARALGVLGGQDAVAALVKALESMDPVVRRAAAEGLARAGGSGVRDELVRAISRPEADADVAAAAALLATFAHPAGAGSTVQESP